MQLLAPLGPLRVSQWYCSATVTVQHLGGTAGTDDVLVGAERSTANQPEWCCQASYFRLGSGDRECSTADGRQFDWWHKKRLEPAVGSVVSQLRSALGWFSPNSKLVNLSFPGLQHFSPTSRSTTLTIDLLTLNVRSVSAATCTKFCPLCRSFIGNKI